MEEENDTALKRAQYVANKLLQTCNTHNFESVRTHIEKAYLIGCSETKQEGNHDITSEDRE